MKKIVALLMTAFMILSLTACSQSNKTNEQSLVDSTNETNIDSSVTNGDNLKSTSKIFVAYFSATGTTKGVAETVADVIDAKLYEIVAKDPYTSEDLDYSDNNSRSTKEMNDPNARPEINGSVENIGQYDIVFIGFPIWWGEAPRIISTFIESYDFSGKTIVPFCTSGGSGIGSSVDNLEKLTSGAVFADGERLNGGASRDDVIAWIDKLNLNISTK